MTNPISVANDDTKKNFGKKNLDHTLCYFMSTLGLFFILFLFKGKVCTRKMSVNRKLVYFEFLVLFRGILGGF